MTVPTKWQIAQYWTDAPGRDIFAPHLEDPTHACCFACGWFSERWAKETPRASWERAALERAHIEPASLGGSAEANNLLLLCGPCHREAPDWFEPWEMARWIATRQERPSKEIEDLAAWIRAASGVPEFSDSLIALANDDGAAERVVGILRESARRAAVHGSGVGLSQATMAAIMRHAVKQVRAAA